MLSNLCDFTPDDRSDQKKLLPEDKWALEDLNNLKQKMNQAYRKYNFAEATKLLFNYLTLDFSQNWLKTETTGLKQRLYLCYEGKNDDRERRSGQTALAIVLKELLVLVEPVLPHLCEEVNRHQSHL
jgi:isoleucyl-tRNA synthetase